MSNTPLDEVRRSGIDVVLHSPAGLQALRNYTVTAHGEENLDFWLQIEMFKCSPQEMWEDISKELWEGFLVPRAPRKINVTFNVKNPIEQAMAAGTYSANMWDGAQAHVYKLLRQNHWNEFLDSKIGADYAERVSQCLCSLVSGKTIPRLKEKQVFALMRGDVYVRIASRYADEKRAQDTPPASVPAKEIEDWLHSKAPGHDDGGIEEICENLVACDVIYTLDPEAFEYSSTSFYRVKGIVYPVGKDEYIEILETALDGLTKINSGVLGWTRLKHDEIFPLASDMKVWRKKGDVSDIWKCEFIANMPAECVFDVLSSTCMGKMMDEAFQVYEDIENIRVIGYISHYADVPQPVHWLTIQTGRKWKDGYIIVETSLKWHPAFSINQNYNSQANLVYRGVVLEPKKQDTNICFFEYSEASSLPNFRLNFAQSVISIMNIVNPASYASLPCVKKLYAETPEFSKKKTSLFTLSKTEKRKTSNKIHNPSASLVALEEALSRISPPSPKNHESTITVTPEINTTPQLQQTHSNDNNATASNSKQRRRDRERDRDMKRSPGKTASTEGSSREPSPATTSRGSSSNNPSTKHVTPPRQKSGSISQTNSLFTISDDGGASSNSNEELSGGVNADTAAPHIETGNESTEGGVLNASRGRDHHKLLAIPTKEKGHKKSRRTGSLGPLDEDDGSKKSARKDKRG